MAATPVLTVGTVTAGPPGAATAGTRPDGSAAGWCYRRSASMVAARAAPSVVTGR